MFVSIGSPQTICYRTRLEHFKKLVTKILCSVPSSTAKQIWQILRICDLIQFKLLLACLNIRLTTHFTYSLYHISCETSIVNFTLMRISLRKTCRQIILSKAIDPFLVFKESVSFKDFLPKSNSCYTRLSNIMRVS